MKQLILGLVAALAVVTASAQDARVYRSEFLTYDSRKGSDAADRSAIKRYIEFAPKPYAADGTTIGVRQSFERPATWTDCNIYLHLENIGFGYTLTVNDQRVAAVEDSFTPADFDITQYIREGNNTLTLDMRESLLPELEKGLASPTRKHFENSYIFCQHNRKIKDFSIALVPDSTHKFGVLKLDVVVENSYNYDEPVAVGYDIYAPNGKLLDYNVREMIVGGRSTDTMHFAPFVYHTYDNKWQLSPKAAATATAPQYRVTLFTKRSGMLWEYIPLKVGFDDVSYTDSGFRRFGTELKLVEKQYNATADKATARREIKALKLKGINTLRPDYPQPEWFYDICDELGIYVIDRANINAPDRRDDRSIGGTPSNDPRLEQEYLSRVKAMYFRSRNHNCVIGFALGGDSGNGYNMYKAYEWLKSVEPSRPIFYEGAKGEWNSDQKQ